MSSTHKFDDYESTMLELWQKNLGLQDISNGDDYFTLGGNSLLATQLIAWVQKKFQSEISLLDIFEFRTISGLTRLIRDRQKSTTENSDTPSAEYFFFGDTAASLLGALHTPDEIHSKQTGVVLCYPMGQEYMRIHRTFFELANSLAAAGLTVLRFDYYGCGDSNGEIEDGNFVQWGNDIKRAIQEMRDRARVDKIYLVGARIGANLAIDVVQDCSGIVGLVIWEPILNGVDYMAKLQQAHQTLLYSNANQEGYRLPQSETCVAEFVGFPISKQLYQEIQQIQLMSGRFQNMEVNALVLGNSYKPSLEGFAHLLQESGVTADYQITDARDNIWLKEDRENKGLIPFQAIQTIVGWFSKR